MAAGPTFDETRGDATVTATGEGNVGTAPTQAGGGAGGDAIAAGTRIGRFVLLERIGAGGMGEVYACHDPDLDRRVAVKLLHPAAGGSRASEQLVQRLRREAQAAAKLSHRHVVTVYDVGIADLDERGEVFVAMELVEGGTLEDWAARPRRWDEVVAMYLQAGRGLAAAHSAGIVHRDFKPTNVLVTRDGDAKVSDFGLATSGDGPQDPGAAATTSGLTSSSRIGSLTRTGAVMGTPMFMAPEQRDGGRVDARADLYAYCVALFRAVYGVHPFGARSDEIARNAAANRVTEPPKVGPPGLLRILRAGIDPDPAKRPADLGVVLRELERLLAPRRWGTVLAIAGAAALLAIVIVAVWMTRRPGASPCTGAPAEMATVWGPAQRAKLVETFAVSGLEFAPDAAERAAVHLDRWRDGWVSAHTGVCRATRVDRSQSEHAMDLRIGCLARARGDLATLVDYLGRGERDTIVRASQLALDLPDLSACDDPERLAAATDEGDAAELAALSARLGEAELLSRLGRYDAGIPIAREVLDAAQARKARALAARAGATLGRLQLFAGDYQPARATLFQAALDAQVTRQHEVAAIAWSATVTVLAGTRATAEEEARVYAQARAALESAGDPPVLEARLLLDHGTYFAQQMQPDVAAPVFRQALDLLRTKPDADELLVASVMDSLGGALADSGHVDEGLALQTDALATRQRLLGDEHPVVARSQHNLAITYVKVSRFAEAEAMFRRALELKISALGPTHPSVSNTYIELEELLATERRFDDAIEIARRDVALWTLATGVGSEDEAASRRELADVLVVAGRPEEALAEYRAVQAAYAAMADAALREQAVKVNASLVRPLVELGRLDDATAAADALGAAASPILVAPARARIALARGRTAEARRVLDEALAVLDKDPDDVRIATRSDLLLLDAETHVAAGHRAAAGARADEVRALCSPVRCGHWTADRLARADAILK